MEEFNVTLSNRQSMEPTQLNRANNNNNNNTINMDELSLDSTTSGKVNRKRQHQFDNEEQEKFFIDQEVAMKKGRDSSNNKRALSKPHFRIDWRQLSYYQKPDSYLSSLFNKLIGKKTHQLEPFDSADQQNDFGSIKSDYSSFTTLSGQNGSEPKRILNSLDGCFKSGELSAILGPSGAGKSTFLSTLFGSKQDSAYGQTKVTWFNENGQVVENKKRRAIKIAVLPQHDHLLNHLTVYEALMFASKIKNSTANNIGNQEAFKRKKNFHRQNVRRVAKMLKLSDCLDTRCGRLSGGQYKRVSIGQELLSEPDVIILDEPTSGLDAMTCLTTVQTLKSIVMKHPMSIILTIHQPDHDVFNLFDHVYVIAQGGLAIYEGPPHQIWNTLAEVNLKPPSSNYNPARFIVENAFVVDSEYGEPRDSFSTTGSSMNMNEQFSEQSSNREGDEDEDDDVNEDSDDDNKLSRNQMGNYIRRSVLSLTEAISGKELSSGLIKNNPGCGVGGKIKKDKKPLLNIGFQTLDGKLITSESLHNKQCNELRRKQKERCNLLKRLNEIQRARYSRQQDLHGNSLDLSSCWSSPSSGLQQANHQANGHQNQHISFVIGSKGGANDDYKRKGASRQHDKDEKSSAKSDYYSSGWPEQRGAREGDSREQVESRGGALLALAGNLKATSLADMTTRSDKSAMNNLLDNPNRKISIGRSLQMVNQAVSVTTATTTNSSDHESVISENDEFVVSFVPGDETTHISHHQSVISGAGSPPQLSSPTSFLTNTDTTASAVHYSDKPKETRLRRQFDKRLSAKHNCAKHNYPVWYHSFLLTHRTWLSVVRDPVFFYIQTAMHIITPILLGLIFGTTQEEGCPKLGNFDLVEFAYSDSTDFIQGTVTSIRRSIGNIGIVFFEMFVLSFSINCITAMVFPADMHVLLKEYRNGWYSLRSYFFGRTLADLPVPITLHTLGLAILYYITNQPQSLARFGAVVSLVILASLVAQSVGLMVGALLMRSSQSAVMTAAGFVSPFFALSGFIVRMHTLPWIAQLGAQCSYLFHLLNGFIIIRYGFGRCPCSEEAFETDPSHQIPSNLHTLASIWIGTYSNEYASSATAAPKVLAGANSTGLMVTNRTNVDPNIDIVDKMMHAFKMANSYGHEIETCDDVLPYAMLDFNLRDSDIYHCFIMLIVMVIVSRFFTFTAIYYKIRSYA